MCEQVSKKKKLKQNKIYSAFMERRLSRYLLCAYSHGSLIPRGHVFDFMCKLLWDMVHKTGTSLKNRTLKIFIPKNINWSNRKTVLSKNM